MTRPVPPPSGAVLLSVPLTGRSLVQHSPADRVPSHGTWSFGSAHAIDLVPVDGRGRSAPRTWRGVVATESPAAFVGFGAAVSAPAAGTVVQVHDGEPDHRARRSQPALVLYVLGQAARARRGGAALAGNHVVIALGPGGPFVLLAHLQCGSVRVQPGQAVDGGHRVGRCGNSGNSTEPHVHLQVSDSTDWPTARGVPFVFRRADGSTWLPRNGSVIDGRCEP
ncbi:peptidoglycan DD-metalloendopeptidase family protein [Nakamurella deserti]|uniref:peptidoglycan DD-metalloendopeptidase family protein n=1 Tax=Nakamurella deserti TaxID=2164074 RepID=UPI000DBE0261|nr:peptidoglycan DD-metalloendopeptidase family protein [Nakamurella deserti]